MLHKFVSCLILLCTVLITPTILNGQFTSPKAVEDAGRSKKAFTGKEMLLQGETLSDVGTYDYRNLKVSFASPDTNLPGWENGMPPLFRKRTWEVPTMKNLRFNSMNHEQNDQDAGSETKLNLSLEAHYFPWNKVGLGMEVQYDHTSSKNGSETVTSDFITFGHVTYGIPMNPKWGIYFRGGAGIGSGKTEFTQGTSSQEIKSDIFSYKFEVGAPIHLNHNLFLNPNLSYKNTSRDFDDQEETESNFRVGIGLVSYLNCGDDYDYVDSMGPMVRRNRYAPGVSFLGIHSMTSYSTGNTETKFNTQTYEEDFSRLNLKVDYSYQIFQNFGLGAEVGLRRSKVESDNIENIRSYFVFVPKATYNFPTTNWLNDAFLTFGGGIGSRKNEITISGNTNEQKDKISVIGGGLGYNWFLHRTSMFTFTAGYEAITEKDSENTDQRFKENGFTFQVGFRTGLGIRGNY